MEHIRETAQQFPFLYYQRIFLKGYVALTLPVIFAVKSELADGYIYVRQHTNGVRVRDFQNDFLRAQPAEQPSRLVANPVRNIEVENCVTADVRAKGREKAFTWLFTKDELPRIINNETFTEFLACAPLTNLEKLPNLNFVTSYFATFADWYRLITGDISISGPGDWNADVPMYGECIVDVRAHGSRPIDEIVLDVDPKGFRPTMFHFDLKASETGTVRPASDGIAHEQRIGHYLATGAVVPVVHRRIAEILLLAQETKDWALVALAMFPVFEQYYDGFLAEVCARNATFRSFVDKKYAGNAFVYTGERIKWLPNALKQLGYEPKSAGLYFGELAQANEERVRVVHKNKRPSFEESKNLARILTNTVLLCETALGRPTAYTVALEKLVPVANNSSG